MQTNTLRPGLLVSFKTTVRGNVSYQHTDIEPEHIVAETGQKLAVWETAKAIVDPAEFEAAQKIRSKVCTMIRGTCVASSFGLLCPEKSADNLENAIAETRRLAETFNAGAKLTRVDVRVLIGRIVQDDLEALAALNSEASDLLATMVAGIQNLNVTEVRKAADRARNLGRMLSPQAEARIGTAIEEARAAARKIVKAGEKAAEAIDQRTIQSLVEARTSFLDFDLATEVAAPAEEGRALDFEPLPETNVPPKRARGARGRKSAPAPA